MRPVGTFRFILALTVVAEHFGGLAGFQYFYGEMAVQCFYLVSGFLIAFIIANKYDTASAAGLRLFYSSRALRIFVPYWIFALSIVALWLLLGYAPRLVVNWGEMEPLTRIYLVFANIFILGQEAVSWLYYDNGALLPVWTSDGMKSRLTEFLIIPQAWSISLELMFYALAPFLVRRHWLLLLAYIVLSYQARRWATMHGLGGSGFITRFFPFELGLFLAGVLSHRTGAHLVARGVPTYLPVSLCVGAALFVMMYYTRQNIYWHHMRFYILVAIALPFLFHISTRFRFDRWLGELSYPIYLCHLAVLGIGSKMLDPIMDRDWIPLVLICATVGVAALFVLLIDAPFERWRQRRYRSAKSIGR